MKCPQCGLVTFDDLPQCPRCKESFALVRPLASASLDGARHVLRDDPELRVKLRDRLHRARLDRRKENENPLAAGLDPDAPDWFEPLPGDDGGPAEAVFATAPAPGGRSEETPIVHSDDAATTADAETESELGSAEPQSIEDDPQFEGDIPGFSDWREELRERLKRIRARREQEQLTDAEHADDEAPADEEPAAEDLDDEGTALAAETADQQAAAEDLGDPTEATDVQQEAAAVEATAAQGEEDADAVADAAEAGAATEQEAETEEESVAEVSAGTDPEAAGDEPAEDPDVAPQVEVVGFGAGISSADDEAVEPVATAGDLIAQIVDGPGADAEDLDLDLLPADPGDPQAVDFTIDQAPEADPVDREHDDPMEAPVIELDGDGTGAPVIDLDLDGDGTGAPVIDLDLDGDGTEAPAVELDLDDDDTEAAATDLDVGEEDRDADGEALEVIDLDELLADAKSDAPSDHDSAEAEAADVADTVAADADAADVDTDAEPEAHPQEDAPQLSTGERVAQIDAIFEDAPVVDVGEEEAADETPGLDLPPAIMPALPDDDEPAAEAPLDAGVAGEADPPAELFDAEEAVETPVEPLALDGVLDETDGDALAVDERADAMEDPVEPPDAAAEITEDAPELEFDDAEAAVPGASLELDLPEPATEEDRALEWDEEAEPARTTSSAGPLGERAAAVLCDTLVLTAIGSALVGAAASGTGRPFLQVLTDQALWLGVTWAIFAAGYSVFFVGSCGQTIGRMVMRLRVIGDDQFSVGFGRAAIRLAAWTVSALPLLAGMLPAFKDPKNRGLHDRLSHTRVVKA